MAKKGYSKQVSDRAKASRGLAQTLETNASALAEAIEKALARGASKPKKLGDLTGLFVAMGALVTAVSEELEAADQAHEREMADDAAPRDEREAAIAAVREVLVDLRSALVAAYPASALKAVGLSGAAPYDGQALLSYGKKVLEGLEGAKLGAPKREGLHVDTKVFAKDLRKQLRALDPALAAVAREQREGEATLATKTKALAENDRTFQRTAAAVEALARFGGRDDIADKVRPSARRPGLPAEEEGEGEPKPAPEG